MMKLSYNRLLAIICFVLPLSLLLSCKKDKDENSGMVELISFGPTGAKHGDTIRFFGNNLNKVTAVQFSGTNAVVEQKDFKQQTTELILLVVPVAAEKGFVTLKTPGGDVVSKTQLNLKVATTVSAITPPQAKPGENITITGNFLNWVNKVTFARDKVVTTFVSRSLNQLVVKVPDDAQTGPLILSYQGTDSSFVQTTDTLKVTLPTITSFSPNPTKHADNVTITGTNLDLTRKVIFTGVSTPVTSFVSQTATQLVVKVPGATQKGKVRLEAASGVQTVSGTDLDVMMPAITSFAPNPIDPGANLTITGTNLDLVSNVSLVGVTNPITNFVSQSASQIVVTVPSGVLKGRVTLGVKNSTLTVQSATDLDIKGGLPPLADFPFPIYTDALQNSFQDWSFTDSRNFSSTAVVRQGTASIRAVYGGNSYQGITFNRGTAIPTAGYTKLEFSVFGEAGTGGKKLNMIINEQWGIQPQVTIKEGEWTTFSIDLSTLTALGSPAQLKQLVLQSAGWTGVIHIDHVGLR